MSAALLALGGLSIWAWTSAGRGPVYYEEQPRTDAVVSGVIRPGPRLWLAGSGTNLPLTRALARGYGGDELAIHPVVHASVGSRGGLAALHDGVIDIALISRPLAAAEQSDDLFVFPYARVPVVFAAHIDVPIRELTTQDVLALYSGTWTTFSTGQTVNVLLREPGDSGTRVAKRDVPGFTDADRLARARPHARVLYHDGDMQDALLSTPGAIGLFNAGAVIIERLPIRTLTLDGIRPTAGNLRDGTYPLGQELSFVTKGPPSAAARQFIKYVFSPRARELIEAGGYLPLEPPPHFPVSP